jgi:hypothetical protein
MPETKKCKSTNTVLRYYIGYLVRIKLRSNIITARLLVNKNDNISIIRCEGRNGRICIYHFIMWDLEIHQFL